MVGPEVWRARQKSAAEEVAVIAELLGVERDPVVARALHDRIVEYSAIAMDACSILTHRGG